LGLFVLLSIPLALFCVWFARQAWKAGRRRLAAGMLLLSLLCLLTAGLSGGWMWLLMHR